MLRRYILCFLMMLCIVNSNAQQKIDSLLQVLSNHKRQDTTKVDLLTSIATEYQNVNITLGIKTADTAIALAQKLDDQLRFATALFAKAQNLIRQSSLGPASALLEQALKIYERLGNKKGIANILNSMGNISSNSTDYVKALEYYKRAMAINEQIGNKLGMASILNNKATVYSRISNYPKALENYKQAAVIYKELGEERRLAGLFGNTAQVYIRLSDYINAMLYYQKALKIYEQTGKHIGIVYTFTGIGGIYSEQSDYTKSLEFYKKALNTSAELGLKDSSIILARIGTVYSKMGKHELAIRYLDKAVKIAEEYDKRGVPAHLNNLGFLYYTMGDHVNAWNSYVKALTIAEQLKSRDEIALIQLSIGELYRDAPDSILTKIGTNADERNTKTLDYLNKGKQGATELGSLSNQRFAWQDLSIAYEKQKDYHKSLDAFKNYIIMRDSILNNEKDKKISRLVMQYDFDKQADSLKLEEQITGEKLKQQVLLAKQQQQEIELGTQELSLINKEKDLQKLAYLKTQSDLQNEQLQKREKEKQLIIAAKDKKLQQAEAIKLQAEAIKTRDKNRVRMYALLSALAVFSLIAVILWRNNRNKQKANALLSQQKQETDEQKTKVEQTLQELKTTQAQLIQREKMASLGELTVGIAHEIQNPLNFVNNFSELNTELIADMEQELNKGNINEAKAIAGNIRQNMEKINMHGKRADGIVKNMQQHSRGGHSKAELTEINALAEEYLRLSYNAFRGNDKSFSATLHTVFDVKNKKHNIVPQDIARVLQNLFNNAFYSVAEKKKHAVNGYEPAIWLTTKNINLPSGAAGLEISVKDNGMGIPQKILDKIYQPFFTTKPTGQGTGLGLSLSYDIITKGMGGNIRAESKEGEFAEFIVQLPA